jgi:hypothetical protein
MARGKSSKAILVEQSDTEDTIEVTEHSDSPSTESKPISISGTTATAKITDPAITTIPVVSTRSQAAEDSDSDSDSEVSVEDIFTSEALPLHPAIVTFLNEANFFQITIPLHIRRKILKKFPITEGFSVRAPHLDHAFVGNASQRTLAKDKQLANITTLQLQAIRPLLIQWSALLSTNNTSAEHVKLLDSIQATVSLTLHAIYSITSLRKRWILADINPNLVSQLSSPSTPSLFGDTLTAKLTQSDTQFIAVKKLKHFYHPNSNVRRGDTHQQQSQKYRPQNNSSSSNNNYNNNSQRPLFNNRRYNNLNHNGFNNINSYSHTSSPNKSREAAPKTL